MKKNTEQPKIVVGSHEFMVEIADTGIKRSQGLSGRKELAQDQGMLFIFSNKKRRNFWMPNMYFPLDIIFIDDNKIVDVVKNIQPGVTNSYKSKEKANYVLEINANLFAKYDFKIGDEVVIEK